MKPLLRERRQTGWARRLPGIRPCCPGIPCKAVFDRFAKPIRRAGFTGASEFAIQPSVGVAFALLFGPAIRHRLP
jgi:hypothetical protein